MNDNASEYLTIDDENPWPGLPAYSEENQRFFYGRDLEAKDIHRLVKRRTLSVLYGKSGLGKTSLIRAGLFPLLRSNGFFPVYIHIDFSDDAKDFIFQIKKIISDEIRIHHVDAPDPLDADRDAESLWEYFHHGETDFWSEKNEFLTPLLVFDQFEELFTLGQSGRKNPMKCEELLAQLSDLAERRPPVHFKAKVNADPNTADAYELEKHNYSILFSLREDFLPDLDALSGKFYSIMQNRLRLEQMNGIQAFSVVSKPGKKGLVDESVAREIVQFVAGAEEEKDDPEISDKAIEKLEIEPALLCVMCAELNYRRIENESEAITQDLLIGNKDEILDDFYDRSMSDQPPEIHIFIENNLLTRSGFRNSVALEDALATKGVTQEAIDILVKRRLLRCEERLGVNRVVLTHDLLTKMIQKKRDERLEKERQTEEERLRKDLKRANRRVAFISLLLIVTIFSFIFTLYFYVGIKAAKDETKFALNKAATALSDLHTQKGHNAGNNEDWGLALIHYKRALDEASSISARIGADIALAKFVPEAAVFGGQGQILAIAVSPKDGLLAYADSNSMLHILATDTWRTLKKIRINKIQTSPAAIMVFGPHGKHLAYVSNDHVVQVINMKTGESIELEGHEASVTSLAFHPDGSLISSASQDATVRIWDLEKSYYNNAMVHPLSDARALAFSKDDAVLNAISSHGSIKQMETPSTRKDKDTDDPYKQGYTGDSPIKAAKDPLWDISQKRSLKSVFFNPKGTRVAALFSDGSLRAWETGTWQEEIQLAFKGEPIRSAAFTPSGNLIVVQDKMVTLRDTTLDGWPRIKAIRYHVGIITHAVESPDERFIVSVSSDGLGRIWSGKRMGPPKSIIRSHRGKMKDVIISPDKRVISIWDNKTFAVWDAITGDRQPESSMAFENRVKAMAFDPTGKFVAWAGDDNMIHYQSREKEKSGWTEKYDDEVSHITFSPDGKTLAYVAKDKIILHHMEDKGKPVTIITGGKTHDILFSPDNRFIYAATADTGSIRRFDRTGQEEKALKGHGKPVRALALGPHGKTIASASEDGEIRLWDNRELKIPEILRGHKKGVNHVVFSPDNTFLVSADDDAVIFWNIADRKKLIRLNTESKVRKMAFGRVDSQKQVLILGFDDYIQIHWFEIDNPPALAKLLSDTIELSLPWELDRNNHPLLRTNPEQFLQNRLMAAKQQNIHWLPDGGSPFIDLYEKRISRANAAMKHTQERFYVALNENDVDNVSAFISERGDDINLKFRDGSTALGIAAKKGYAELLEMLLDQGADVNTTDTEGKTPLDLALEFDQPSIIKALISRRVNVDPILNNAVSQGDRDTLYRLLENGADPDTKNDEGASLLITAIEQGYNDIAEMLIEKNADIHATDKSGWTPLMSAARYGYGDVVGLLLENGADPGDQNDKGWTPFILAAYSGNFSAIERLYALDPGLLKDKNKEGVTALMAAAWQGHTQTMTFLLEKGAEKELTSKNGWTAVMYGARYGQLAPVSLLQKSGANINAKDNQGWTPVKSASRNGHANVVQFLIDKGADIKERDDDGWSPVMSAASYGHVDVLKQLIDGGGDIKAADNAGWTSVVLAAYYGHTNTLTLLLETDPKQITSKNNEGINPLMAAAWQGHVKVIELLIQKGADIHIKSNKGWPAIMYGARYGHPEVVMLLIERGADIESRDKDGWTPVMSAASYGHTDALKQLIEDGGNIKATDTAGWTSVVLAAYYGHDKTVKLLIDTDPKQIASINQEGINPLMAAAWQGHIKVVELLIKRGADIHKKSHKGWPAIMYGARYGHADAVRLLIENGADIESRDKDGWTPLMSAARNGHDEAVGLLLEKGANTEAVDSDAWTSLMSAARYGHHKIITLLLEKGADSTAKNNFGWTPFLLSAYSGNITSVEQLFNSNPDLMNDKNSEGVTALMAAAWEGKTEVLGFLLEKGADIEAASDNGWTAIMYAAGYGHVEASKALLEKGANIEATDKALWTPLMSAARYGHVEVVKLLLEKGADSRAATIIGEPSALLASDQGHQEVVQVLTGQATVKAPVSYKYKTYEGYLDLFNQIILLADAKKHAGDSIKAKDTYIDAFALEKKMAAEGKRKTDNQRTIVLGRLSSIEYDLEHYSQASIYLEKKISLLKKEIKRRGLSLSLLSTDFVSLSWRQILSRQFQAARKTTLEGLESSTGNNSNMLSMNLSHAYLFTNEFEKSEKIHLEYKGVTFNNDKTWSQVVEEDFSTLREKGIVNPGMARIETLLGIQGK